MGHTTHTYCRFCSIGYTYLFNFISTFSNLFCMKLNKLPVFKQVNLPAKCQIKYKKQKVNIYIFNLENKVS